LETFKVFDRFCTVPNRETLYNDAQTKIKGNTRSWPVFDMIWLCINQFLKALKKQVIDF